VICGAVYVRETNTYETKRPPPVQDVKSEPQQDVSPSASVVGTSSGSPHEKGKIVQRNDIQMVCLKVCGLSAIRCH